MKRIIRRYELTDAEWERVRLYFPERQLGDKAHFSSVHSIDNDKASEAHYNNANTLWQSGDLQGAVAEFEALGAYSDAPQLLTQVNTEIANKALEEKDYATALTAYQHLEQTDEIKAKEYELAQACYDPLQPEWDDLVSRLPTV